jgi:hypothetical protein
MECKLILVIVGIFFSSKSTQIMEEKKTVSNMPSNSSIPSSA